jgi:hypothetical protein
VLRDVTRNENRRRREARIALDQQIERLTEIRNGIGLQIRQSIANDPVTSERIRLTRSVASMNLMRQGQLAEAFVEQLEMEEDQDPLTDSEPEEEKSVSAPTLKQAASAPMQIRGFGRAPATLEGALTSTTIPALSSPVAAPVQQIFTNRSGQFVDAKGQRLGIAPPTIGAAQTSEESQEETRIVSGIRMGSPPPRPRPAKVPRMKSTTGPILGSPLRGRTAAGGAGEASQPTSSRQAGFLDASQSARQPSIRSNVSGPQHDIFAMPQRVQPSASSTPPSSFMSQLGSAERKAVRRSQASQATTSHAHLTPTFAVPPAPPGFRYNTLTEAYERDYHNDGENL